MHPEEVLASNLSRVQTQIVETAQRVGRRPEEITLVAVSKTQPLALLKLAHELGISHFGENRVQEAQSKISAWHPAEVHWHLLGHLQTNKANKVAGKFQCIHSVDSWHLAETLNRHIAAHSMGSQRQPILLQVNISGETSKEGIKSDMLTSLAHQIIALEHLEIQGLMTIAPLTNNAEEVRSVFRSLRELRDIIQNEIPECSWQHLSMGMSNDYQVAIEEGATIVRIGRAIFGERSKKGTF